MNPYGFFIGLGAVIVLITVDRYLKDKIKITDYLVIAIITLLFARLGFFLNYLGVLVNNPFVFLKIYQGGLSIFGGFFGLGISAFFVAKKRKLNFLSFTDVLLLNFPLAQSIGRIGNYFNQEVYGKPSEIFWSIYIRPENRIPEYMNYSSYHPIFAYEMFLNLLNWFFLLILRKKYRASVGLITCFYMLNYGLIRLTVNRFRLEKVYFLNIDTSDLFAVILYSIGCIILLSMIVTKKTQIKVAEISSKVLNPFLITMTPFLIIAFQRDLFKIEPLHITVIFLIGIVGPIVQINLFKKFNLINDWDISDRSKRPLFTSIAGIIFFVIFLVSLASVSLEIKILTLSLTVVTFLFAIISTQWKISGHLTYLAFTLASIYLLVKDPLIIFALSPLIVLIAWSRVKLKHHDILQTIAGTFLGVGIIVLLWLLATKPLPF